MKNAIILLVFVFALASCKSKEEKVTRENSAALLQKDCYVYNENGNTISMEITEIGNEVKANLTYALAEKDINEGIFQGSITGNKLFGKYTFSSEGTESFREVAFLIKENQLIEGFGELDQTGNTFKKKNKIIYNSNMPLTKTDCGTWKQTCLFINGKSFSSLKQTCVELDSLNIKLNPLKDGSMAKGKHAYILFNKTQSEAEIFLPYKNKGIVLKQTHKGNWQNEEYKLIAWKGWVLQKNGRPIFGGE